jgi:hypothetical protein
LNLREIETKKSVKVTANRFTSIIPEEKVEEDKSFAQLGLISSPCEPIVTEEPITVDRAAQILHVNSTELANQFVNADFYIYTKRVRGFKSVILVKTRNNEAFVLKVVKSEYPEAYRVIQEKQRRPEARFFEISSQHPSEDTGIIVAHDYGVSDSDSLVTMGVFDFVGSIALNPSDCGQIQQLASMGMSFAKENDVFDDNAGNIIVKDGKLYYIDLGLTYFSELTTCLNLLSNIKLTPVR